MTDSHFYVTRPGVLFREVYTVGGQVLVLAGNAIFTGCTFTSSLLFVNVVGTGDTLAVFGGNGKSIHPPIESSSSSKPSSLPLSTHHPNHPPTYPPPHTTAIFTGCTFTFNCALVAGYGVGFLLFMGGGVAIFTGKEALFPPTHLPTCLPTHPPTHLPTCISIHRLCGQQ